MKTVWVDVRPYNKKIATTALESGADAIIVDKGYTKKIKELGRINTIAPDGDIILGKNVVEVKITDKKDEIKAALLGKNKTVIVETSDWMIIPLENLIAQSDKIFAVVKNLSELEVALGILEKGVSGVVLKNFKIQDITKAIQKVKYPKTKIQLQKFIIDKVDAAGMGDRVCVDTCTRMNPGEGMLVGNTSMGLFFVHSETEVNPYVEPRPFRVNAGGIHAYVLSPENKTNYLSELKSGDKVLIVNYKGETQIGIVGRVKIERRPMLYIQAHTENTIERFSIILQNAETIRLVNTHGKPLSVVSLKKGDAVLGYLLKSARHFGLSVEETILEK
ncbi:MAG: 3-dehydroquinate synthase II [Candidatus Hydrogenedentota bacterium]